MTRNDDDHDRIEELEDRLAKLEAEVEGEKSAVQPLLELYVTGKVIGRTAIILAGAASGIIAIWSAIGDYIGRHWK